MKHCHGTVKCLTVVECVTLYPHYKAIVDVRATDVGFTHYLLISRRQRH